jgi:hypothetical protein
MSQNQSFILKKFIPQPRPRNNVISQLFFQNLTFLTVGDDGKCFTVEYQSSNDGIIWLHHPPVMLSWW